MAALSGGDYKKDEDGVEWLGSRYGLIRYDPKTKKGVFLDSVHNSIKEDYPVNNIIILTNGYLLASTYESGFLLVNRKTPEYKEFPPKKINPEGPLETVSSGNPVNNRIDCTYKLNDSIILCSCGGGLSIFNWQKQTFTYFKSNKSDPTSLLESNLRIYSILKDREGIIWLGGKGLEKYDFKDYAIKKFRGYRRFDKQKPFVGYNDISLALRC